MSIAELRSLPFLMADFGEESLLPDLHNVSYVHSTVVWDDTLTGEDVRWMRYGRVNSILPYLGQNSYTREKKTEYRSAVVLENKRVKAVLLPWMGGRLWSLQIDGREVLSRNPVVQPCNLALRNAWCSGGVEWNVSIRGHNMLTCQTLFTELIRLEDGTAGVRFYEYERIRGIVYRLEAYLPEDSEFLFVQVHIENPVGNGERPMYWWSNIAVPEEEGMKVVSPAKTAVLSLYDAGQYRMLRTPLPRYEDMDLSAPCEIPRSVDVFFDIPSESRPFITALGKDHSGLVQCSTKRLFGRKLFVWGMGQGGRHWQEVLSDGKTRYVEIQAGIAKTQQDHIPMPEGQTWEWLEAYGRMECDLDGADYEESVRRCEKTLENLLSSEKLEREFAGRGRLVGECRGKLAVSGSGWGALENLRREKAGLPPISAVCLFPRETMGTLQAPWRSLLDHGSFGQDSVAEFPKAYLTEPVWEEMLVRARQTPAVRYFLGVISHSRGDAAKAETYFLSSLEEERSAPVLRALARTALLAGNGNQCVKYYSEALKKCGNLPELRLEYAQTLQALQKYEELLSFLDSLPDEYSGIPRFEYLRATAFTALGRYREAEAILRRPLVIPDMREGELSLCDLWFNMYSGMDGTDRAETEKNHPLPKELDFRMH